MTRSIAIALSLIFALSAGTVHADPQLKCAESHDCRRLPPASPPKADAPNLLQAQREVILAQQRKLDDAARKAKLTGGLTTGQKHGLGWGIGLGATAAIVAAVLTSIQLSKPPTQTTVDVMIHPAK